MPYCFIIVIAIILNGFSAPSYAQSNPQAKKEAVEGQLKDINQC